MDKIISSFTVFFENPFWVGVFESESKGIYSVCKVVFGPEPKDYEVYEFLMKNYPLMKFVSHKSSNKRKEKNLNPKRMQKEIKKQLENKGVGTKAQQAIKQSYEQSKSERKKLSKEKREIEKDRAFQIRQDKKKEKHRGH